MVKSLNCEVFEITASILTEPPLSIQVSKLLSEEPNKVCRLGENQENQFEKYVSHDVFLLLYMSLVS